jgi:hypothetical protein
MLPNNLTTNEVKDAAGAEVQFLYLRKFDRTQEYAKDGESPNLQYRLKVSHLETGTGTKLRRRSLVRVDKTVTGVDLTPVTVSCYCVLDFPVGNQANTTEAKAVVANLMSFLASQGATTTILYDCSGYGADAIINGSL